MAEQREEIELPDPMIDVGVSVIDARYITAISAHRIYLMDSNGGYTFELPREELVSKVRAIKLAYAKYGVK